MIPIENINTLQPASVALAAATDSPDDLLRQAMARTINIAANSGSDSIIWSQRLPEWLSAEVEAMGYTVTPNRISADFGREFATSWIISMR